MYGPSKNARTFVVISDGQVWSGNVERAINEAAKRGIAVDVIGIGTSNGGVIPLPRDDKGVVLAGFEPIRSTIDRTSLREIARAGNGEYFEIGTAPDEQIAARIIHNASRRSGNEQVDESLDELYWYLLLAAAGCIGVGALFVKQRLQLAFGLAAALLLLVFVSSLRS
jgi:Ca-activated chloride channel family protein